VSLAAALPKKACGFVPFITAGDPSLAATAAYLKELGNWADVIEVGVPFSDPVADGPTIQAASGRALKAGTTIEKVLSMLERLRREGFATPVVLFTYLNPGLRFGDAGFAARLKKAGVQGALVVDLPVENAGCVADELKKRGLEPVLLASPTTSDARLRKIGRLSGSLVYYVSREGVTGARSDLPKGLKARLAKVRRLTGKPLIVGFGVSKPEHARALAPVADAVVVGSALVSEISRARNTADGVRRVRRFCSSLKRGLSC
jgi:tryptophan synthase alpha subunit